MSHSLKGQEEKQLGEGYALVTQSNILGIISKPTAPLEDGRKVSKLGFCSH